ncbi:MAG: hypothetical protein AAGJ52_04770 [Pseudomonadota bacterium]
MPRCLGVGEMNLLLPLMARQTQAHLPVMLAAPPWIPCPQRLARGGVALDQLLIIRDGKQAFWAAEQGLKSGLCGLVLLWPPKGRVSDRAVRRLQLAAEQGAAPVFICYRPGQQPPASLAALRLAVHSGPELELLRGSSTQAHRFHLGQSNIISWPGTRQGARTRSRLAPVDRSRHGAKRQESVS